MSIEPGAEVHFTSQYLGQITAEIEVIETRPLQGTRLELGKDIHIAALGIEILTHHGSKH